MLKRLVLNSIEEVDIVIGKYRTLYDISIAEYEGKEVYVVGIKGEDYGNCNLYNNSADSTAPF